LSIFHGLFYCNLDREGQLIGQNMSGDHFKMIPADTF
jgi:hypothetical protein